MPAVPTTNKVRGSGRSFADATRCQPVGTVNATPLARRVRPPLALATEVSASASTTEATNLIPTLRTISRGRSATRSGNIPRTAGPRHVDFARYRAGALTQSVQWTLNH